MPSRVVEAFTAGMIIASYPIGMYRMGRRVTSVNFIEAAKDHHYDAGLDVEQVETWRVRRIRPGEYAEERSNDD